MKTQNSECFFRIISILLFSACWWTKSIWGSSAIYAAARQLLWLGSLKRALPWKWRTLGQMDAIYISHNSVWSDPFNIIYFAIKACHFCQIEYYIFYCVYARILYPRFSLNFPFFILNSVKQWLFDLWVKGILTDQMLDGVDCWWYFSETSKFIS